MARSLIRRSQQDNAALRERPGRFAGPSLRQQYREQLNRAARNYRKNRLDPENPRLLGPEITRGIVRGLAISVAMMEHPYDWRDHVKSIEREAINNARKDYDS